MLPAVWVAVEVGERVAVAEGPGELVAVWVRGGVRVKVAVGVVRLAVGELLGVADGVIFTVGVTLGDGVVVPLGVDVAAVVAVSDGVGDCGGKVRSATTAVASATLTRLSPFTSELSHVLGPPNTMASTASMSAWSTRPSQLASPRKAVDCAGLAVASSAMSNAAQTDRIH